MKPGAKVSRRQFMKGSAALVVGFGATGLVARFGLSPATTAAQGINGTPSNQLDSWIAIAADGKVTASTGKCELGHGLHTAQTQLVAEELSVAVRSRNTDSVRYRAHARPGHNVRSAIASDELQPGQPRNRCSHRARYPATPRRNKPGQHLAFGTDGEGRCNFRERTILPGASPTAN